MIQDGHKKPWFFTAQKHKKKFIFFAVLGSWGLNYSVEQYRDYLRRRKFCFLGKKYGDVKINAITRPRRLILFLNPEANDGKAVKSYEKNAAPILHLGGVEITTVKTDYEGQCKVLTQYIDPKVDGILVAGGDGTLLEVITGLLRRKDQNEISKIPIGVIPLGRNNQTYKTIIANSIEQNVTTIAESALNILNNNTKDVSVMEITTNEGKPTYAIEHIKWGPVQDAKENRRYWWTGPLKRILPYIVTVYKKWPPVVSALVSYSPDDTLNSVGDEEKGKKLERFRDISFSGLCVKLVQDTKRSSLKASVMSSDLKKIDFIKLGWRQESETTVHDERIKTAKCSQFHVKPQDEEISWFTIDGEKYEARNINVQILQNKIKMFCPSR
ncbi:acylglycerol kinase, mitochondrial-like [Xenia sp. Carnegie-2017]|uniref:acylglycerol kinase, mitochondrial-like n=1 Tax=Xenia sp. Carnegie-2017 TaxID=2897299 RepID=UPI001F040035|nr:acylglycerol kinase, mitochondrial-like [Xenia sp. Carnegie-2017]